MATVMWEVVQKIQCERLGQAAEFLEERVYPNDLWPDVNRPFRVRASKCSRATECNLAGYACRWAYTNPNYDPSADR